MPRVHTRTKSTRGKRQFICRACGQAVEPGQRFYTWEKRYGGPQYRHVSCGYPRPTELSNRKTAIIDEAVGDIEWPTPSFDPVEGGGLPEADAEGFLSDLRSALESVADTAEEVGQEYEASADNMPESLQYGAQAEAMRDVASRLEDWASDLRSFDPSCGETPEWPEREDDESDEDFADRVQTAFEGWADDARQEAEDALSEVPEYEG